MFRDLVKKYEKNSIIISILMLIVSLFLIFMPFSSAVTVILIFGIFTIIDGIVHIVSYFRTEPDNKLANFEFAEGIMGIIAGISLLCRCFSIIYAYYDRNLDYCKKYC